MTSRRFEGAYMPAAVKNQLNDELWHPFLGGGSLVTRAQLNTRLVDLMGERGIQPYIPQRGPYSQMSLNARTLLANSLDPRRQQYTETLFVPASGHPQLKFDNGQRISGTLRVCRSCAGSSSGYMQCERCY